MGKPGFCNYRGVDRFAWLCGEWHPGSGAIAASGERSTKVEQTAEQPSLQSYCHSSQRLGQVARL